MRGLFRDGVLFLGCVVIPCLAGWSLEDPSTWAWIHVLGAALFVLATLMVFAGLRLLLAAPSTPPSRPAVEPLDRRSTDLELEVLAAEAARAHPDLVAPASSEIIHIEYKMGSARVVALLKLGDGPRDLHLLELDVTGEDLRPEVIEEAVAGVATGEPVASPAAPVDKVGYACGWGLTLPCPPLQH